MKPHKHAELIKAWADGAEIEVRATYNKWLDCTGSPSWLEDMEYRIKPESKPDVVHYHRLTQGCRHNETIFSLGIKNIKLTFDGETGELKSAEVLK